MFCDGKSMVEAQAITSTVGKERAMDDCAQLSSNSVQDPRQREDITPIWGVSSHLSLM